MNRAWATLRERRGLMWKFALVIALVCWPGVYKNLYGLNVMTTAGFFAILTISVGLILGQAGQLSFGHAAFYGIGAYAAALLAMKAHWPTPVGLIAGGVIAALIALVVGRPVLKLRYFYLALATIGLGQIFLVLVLELRDFTGGEHGLGPIPPLELFGFTVDTYLSKYYVIWAFVLVILLFTQRSLRNRVGRSLRALATSEIAASTLGVRTANWKLLAFVLSAFYCGIAGGLFAYLTSAISPGAFTFTAGVLPVVMMLVGGETTMWGGVVGAIVMTWVGNIPGLQTWSGIVFSVIMLLLLIFLPGGITGGLSAAQRARVQGLFSRGRKPDAVECAVGAESGLHPDQCETEMPLPVAPVIAGSPPAEAERGVLLDDLATREHLPLGDEPLLRVEGVSVQFGGLKAVNDVSITVNEGAISALIGPNGAGKTTLFNVISSLQKPSAGRVWFGGTEVTSSAAAATARLGMARTFQNLRIFPNMSVLDNVLIGCHRHEHAGIVGCGLGTPGQRAEEKTSRARAFDALELVGMADHAFRPAASLPYGQQRLVEIARALASEPKLLLLDEPAAGMNAEERAYLVDRIATIRAAGVTVLLVEHDIELVMGISEDVSVLDYGKLIASGRPEMVRADKGVISAYLGVDSDREQDLCLTRHLLDIDSEDLLVVEDLSTAYGAIEALHGVSLSVPKGEIVAVLGANGAGKTTLLHTISGLLRPKGGRVTYQGADITRLAADKIVARGLCHVPEGRQLFPTLSVEDNLLMGSSGRKKSAAELAEDIAYIYELFPVLGRAARADGRHPVGRRAADAGHRPRADRAPRVADPRRALHGTRAPGRGAHLRSAGHTEPTGLDHVDGRAERGDGALGRPPRRRPADGERDALRQGHRAETG